MNGRDLMVQYSWLMRHPDRDMRRESYHSYYKLDDLTVNNQALFTNRRKMAHALNFDSFAHRALMLSAPKGPEEVGYFLRSLSDEMQPFLIDDRRYISQFVDDSSPPGPWDIYAVANLQSPQVPMKLNFYDCLNGFFELAETLFGISFSRETPKNGEVWHDSVLKFKVAHNEVDYGTIYVDPFSRQEKRCMDCHFTVRCGKRLSESSYQNPIIVVSFSCQNRGKASEISHDELTTIFHEMGHAVHSIMARTRYQHLFGTRISTDFAEVPSTLFERFATVPAVLRMCKARNYSGELLELTDDESRILRNSARNSSNIPAIELQNTIFTALCDLELHGPTEEDFRKTINRVAVNHAPFEADGTSGWWNRFSHFAIYGAKYYSYLWAQAVAGRIWSQLFESNPLNRDAGMVLYNGFLKHGNGLSPAEMYRNCTDEDMQPTLLIDEIIQQFKSSTIERYNDNH